MSAKDLKRAIAKMDPENALVDLYDSLIADNPKANKLKPDSWRLTKGQRLLYAIAFFHYDISNGGVEQYLWNQPWMAYDALEYIQLLGLEDLCSAFEPFVDMVDDRKGEWYQLRSSAGASEEEAPSAFQDSRRLVGGSAFNDLYYGSADSENESSVGFGEVLSKAVLEYVQSNPSEFVRVA